MADREKILLGHVVVLSNGRGVVVKISIRSCNGEISGILFLIWVGNNLT